MASPTHKRPWPNQLPAFTSAGYTVLTYDNRGVGKSSRASRDGEIYTAEDMASDLRNLVRSRKVDVEKPYHVMGVSMGGMIAQTYVLNYCLKGGWGEGELLSLTLGCTYAAPGPFCGRMFSLWNDMAKKMSVADVMRDVLLWCFTQGFFKREQGGPEDVEEEMERIDDEMGLASYLAQLNVIRVFDTTEKVGRLGGGAVPKVFVVAGEEDILIPTSLSRELAGLIEGSVFRATKGGHACMWEFPEDFNRVCLEGWREAEGGGVSQAEPEEEGSTSTKLDPEGVFYR